MQSILEELYMGQIGFDNVYYDKDTAFTQSAREKQDSFEALLNALEGTEKNLFEQYCDAGSNMEEISKYRLFTAALKFGILLMAELLQAD